MAILHLQAMTLYAFLVSIVFGTLSKDTPRARFIYGAKTFGVFLGVAFVLGWILYFVPR